MKMLLTVTVTKSSWREGATAKRNPTYEQAANRRSYTRATAKRNPTRIRKTAGRGLRLQALQRFHCGSSVATDNHNLTSAPNEWSQHAFLGVWHWPLTTTIA